MQINKRILALLMSVVIMMSVCVFSVQSETEEIPFDISDYNVARKLNAIGIIDKVSEEEMAKIPTRQDCAELMAKFINIPVSAGTYSESPFFDVNPATKSASSIITLYNMGYVSRGEDLKFYPERPLTANEAVTFIVRAMGYGPMAERLGGYPTGYFSVAGKYKVTENVTLVGNETLRMVDLYRMIDKALDAPAYTYVGTQGEEDIYSFDGTNSILAENHKIAKVTGIISENSVTSLTSTDSVLSDDEIKINGKIYTYADSTFAPLGKSVIAYSNSEDEIIYIEEDTKKNNSQKFDSDILLPGETTDSKLYYKKGDKKDYVSLENNVKVIYNGKSRTNYYALSSVLPTYGFVEAIDNNRNSSADVLIIEDYKTTVVSHVDSYECVIYDKEDATKNIAFDGDVSLSVTDALTGEKISTSMLYKGMVLSVAESNDKKVVKCLAGGEKINGRISGVSQRDGKTLYTINDTEYRTVADRTELDIALGTQGVFTLDAFGAIAIYGMDTAETDDFAYGVISGHEEVGGFDDTLELRMFDVSGNFAVYPVKDKVKIDGIVKKIKEDSVKTEIINQEGNIVRYRVVDDKIAELDFATVVDRASGESASGTLGTLTQIAEGTQFERRSNICTTDASYSFYSKLSSAKVFSIPNDLTKTDIYSVNNAASVFVSNTVYTSSNIDSGFKIKCYNMGIADDGADEATIFLLKSDNYEARTSKNLTHYSVVSAITSSYNEDVGTDTKRLYLNGNSAYFDIAEDFTAYSYPTGHTFADVNLKPGDAITYTVDPKGRIDYIKIWYRIAPSATDKSILKDSAPLNGGSAFDNGTVRGIANITGIDHEKKIITYKTTDGQKIWTMTYETPTVMLVRNDVGRTGNVSKISTEELMVGDKMVFFMSYTVAEDIVVYR